MTGGAGVAGLRRQALLLATAIGRRRGGSDN